jgi:hypothetical protein
MVAGLPTYTKEQFKQVRPTGSYGNYLKFINTRRGVTQGPKWPGRGGPGLPTYESLIRSLPAFQTPQQMEAQANRMAATAQRSSQQTIADTYKQAQDDAMRRMLAFQAAGRAAAAMNSSLIGQVGGQYQAGADELSALASSGAASMAASTQGAIDSAMQATSNVGMPGVDASGAGVMANPLQQAGVEQFYGGTIPAQGMQNAGGYAQAGMAGQISAQNLRATQEAQAAYMQAMGEAGQARTSSLKDLLSQRPGVAGDYLLKLQDAQRQQYALAMSLIGNRRQALQTGFAQKQTKIKTKAALQQQAFEQGMTVQQFKENQRQFDSKLKLTAQQNAIELNRIDASASRVNGFLVNKAGQTILGKNGQPIPVQSGYGSGKTASGLTPYQATRATAKAEDLAQELYYGYVKDPKTGKRIPAYQAGGFDGSGAGSATWGTGRVPYDQAMRRIVNMGVPQAAASQILSQYYDRGDQGRPVFSTQEQKALRKFYGPKTRKWLNDTISRALSAQNFDEVNRWIALALSGRNPGLVNPKA